MQKNHTKLWDQYIKKLQKEFQNTKEYLEALNFLKTDKSKNKLLSDKEQSELSGMEIRAKFFALRRRLDPRWETHAIEERDSKVPEALILSQGKRLKFSAAIPESWREVSDEKKARPQS